MGMAMTGQGRMGELTLGKLRVLSDHSLRRASESLTSLLGPPVRLTASSVTFVPIGVLATLAATADGDPMVALRIQITGEASGQMIILFPRHTVFHLLGVLLGEREERGSLSDEERSAIQEVGNILASTFLTRLGDLLQRRLIPTPPQIHLDDAPGLMQQVVAELEGEGSEVLMVQATFEDPEERIEGRFFVLPEMASLAPLLRGVGAGEGSEG